MRRGRMVLFALLGLVAYLIASPVAQPQDAGSRLRPVVEGVKDGLFIGLTGTAGLALGYLVFGTPPGWGAICFVVGMSVGAAIIGTYEEAKNQIVDQNGNKRRALTPAQEQAQDRVARLFEEEGEAGIQRRITRGANILKELSKPGGVLSAGQRPQWYIDVVNSVRQASTYVKATGPFLNVKVDIAELPPDLVKWTQAQVGDALDLA